MARPLVGQPLQQLVEYRALTASDARQIYEIANWQEAGEEQMVRTEEDSNYSNN